MRLISRTEGSAPAANHPAGSRIHVALAGMLAIGLVGCATSGPGSPLPSTVSTPSSTPVTSPSTTGGTATLPLYNEGEPRPIPAGTYITAAPEGFFPGLALTIPAGWSATETDRGELALRPADRENDALLLWKDVVAVVTHNRDGKVGKVLDGVDSSADALVQWFTSNSDFEILTSPKAATVGDGIRGVELRLTTSNTANFAWNDCPDSPHCVAILKDPGHWGDSFFAIGGAEVARIFVTTLPYPGEPHTFWVTLDAANEADLEEFAAEAKPIIDSLRLPSTYVAN